MVTTPRKKRGVRRCWRIRPRRCPKRWLFAWILRIGSRYGRPKRRVAAALAVGYTTHETVQRFQLFAARVCQLRREFEKSWESFQGESAGVAAKAASA
jgi:hypothetical protein